VVRRAGRLLLGVTVIGELLAGFACGERERPNRKELSLFLASPRIESPPVSTDTADAYAHLYRDLKRKGRPIPTNDLWIAAS
jgi:tRNA(fMet)-specific endonuclease VapC